MEHQTRVASARGYAVAAYAVLLAACGGSGSAPPPITYTANSGVAQKGPLIQGSIVTAQELDAALAPSGKQYSYQVTSDLGTFTPNSKYGSQYIGINATGYYFDRFRTAFRAGPLRSTDTPTWGVVAALRSKVLSTEPSGATSVPTHFTL